MKLVNIEKNLEDLSIGELKELRNKIRETITWVSSRVEDLMAFMIEKIETKRSISLESSLSFREDYDRERKFLESYEEDLDKIETEILKRYMRL